MFRILTIAVVLIAVASATPAQEAGQPDTEAGRYVLRRVDDGLMRLDRETGATSFCRKRGESWVCEAVADDRIALEDEIARLAEDNAELAREVGRLKERVATLEGSAGEPEAEAKENDGGGDKKKPKSDSPSDEEIDKVMKTFEMMMRRFMDIARDLRKEFEEDRL